jgi:hypothetical protein
LNAYLICLRYTQGSTIKRKVYFGRSVSRRVQLGGVSPWTVYLGGTTPDRKIPLQLMTKGDRFIRYRLRERAKRHGSKGRDGHRERMSDMNSVLHQIVSINAKWGYC